VPPFDAVCVLAWAGSLAPGAWLALEAAFGMLGPDPLAHLLEHSGLAAISLLLATLAVTPLRRFSVWAARLVAARWGRRLSDWNRLIRLRRLLGVSSFGYATLHVGFYVVLDAGLDAQELLHDVLERPFVAFGLLAWLMLLPLAATSTRAAMRALGGRWQKLHLLVYPAALTALLHDATHTKHGHTLPLATGLLLALLLGVRVVAWWRGERGPATEVAAREFRTSTAAAPRPSRCSPPSAPCASVPRTGALP
jgi:sulfoxide reductase heme-binding subunit YedZ